jgi:hypothetical protein
VRKVVKHIAVSLAINDPSKEICTVDNIRRIYPAAQEARKVGVAKVIATNQPISMPSLRLLPRQGH